jgi:hypothetical protein
MLYVHVRLTPVTTTWRPTVLLMEEVLLFLSDAAVQVACSSSSSCYPLSHSINRLHAVHAMS